MVRSQVDDLQVGRLPFPYSLGRALKSTIIRLTVL